MSPFEFIGKIIFTFEGHVIGEISKPKDYKPGQTKSFGEVWYELVYNKMLPDIFVTTRCFVCEKDYRLFDRTSKDSNLIENQK